MKDLIISCVGVMLGSIITYYTTKKIQIDMTKKSMQLKNMQDFKAYLHDYMRILAIRDLLIKDHRENKINNEVFEEKDIIYQEKLRIATRNILLISCYIDYDIVKKFENINDSVTKNIFNYYSVYIDNISPNSVNIVNDSCVAYIDDVLEIIKTLDKRIKKEIGID